MNWQLWQRGPVEKQIEGITPLLASWEKKTHPSQVCLREYLTDVVSRLLPLRENVPLFLHLDVDVGDPQRLLRHYDLENYLTPLFGREWLPAARFNMVSARKYVGGGSRICWGVAKPGESQSDGWSHFAINAGSGASASPWKKRIRNALAATESTVLPPGPVKVRLAWQCSASRNWSGLWKPTGDAMAPVLGAADNSRPFNLDDDRIVELELHRNVDDSLGHDVMVAMWWRRLGDNCQNV
jgi:hypothetical protein